jgi:hypothetical protein
MVEIRPHSLQERRNALWDHTGMQQIAVYAESL